MLGQLRVPILSIWPIRKTIRSIRPVHSGRQSIAVKSKRLRKKLWWPTIRDDFTFTKGRLVELVEIKGTSEAAERFFMTRNEFAFKSNKGWRLAIVTDALSEKSVVRIYTLKQFERRFALEPLAYVGASVQE